jgi:putative phosphoesterase
MADIVCLGRYVNIQRTRRIGLISDTHGLLRPEALAFLRGAEHIIHAGDIGKPQILEALRALAPLTAVRGNNDRERWAAKVPESAVLRIGEVSIYVLHNVAELDPDAARKHRVVVSGHSHKPMVKEVDGVLYVNPGSAGPRRFTLPIAVGELRIEGAAVDARIQELRV